MGIISVGIGNSSPDSQNLPRLELLHLTKTTKKRKKKNKTQETQLHLNFKNNKLGLLGKRRPLCELVKE